MKVKVIGLILGVIPFGFILVQFSTLLGIIGLGIQLIGGVIMVWGTENDK